ncbi:MAG: hypothetical protein AAF547_16070 [Actinomycetota bacterium]
MNSHDSWTDGPFDPRALPRPDATVPPQERRREPMRMVDRIAIRKIGGFNFLTPEQWNAMSSKARRKAVEDQSVSFLCDGEAVPLRPALEYLKWVSEQLAAERLAAAEPTPHRQAPAEPTPHRLGEVPGHQAVSPPTPRPIPEPPTPPSAAPGHPAGPPPPAPRPPTPPRGRA